MRRRKYLVGISLRKKASLCAPIFFRLLSRICGLIPVLEVVRVCDIRRFPSLRRCGSLGSSGHYSDLVVETFHSTRGDLTLRTKPVQNQILVSAQHAGDFSHGFYAAARSAFGRVVEKGSGPEDRLTFQKSKKVSFSSQPRAIAILLVSRVCTRSRNSSSDPATATQQPPAQMLQLLGSGFSHRPHA